MGRTEQAGDLDGKTLKKLFLVRNMNLKRKLAKLAKHQNFGVTILFYFSLYMQNLANLQFWTSLLKHISDPGPPIISIATEYR